MQISRDRIRLQVAASRPTAPIDILTNGTPELFVNDDWQFECALFTDDGTFLNLADISDVSSLTFELKNINSKSGLPLLSQTLSSSDLNVAMTLAQWQTQDPAKWQALFTFPNALTNIPLSADQQTFWFTIYAVTNDSVPRQVVWGCGSITLINSGSYTPAPAYVQQPVYLTLAQANALFGGFNIGAKVNKTGDVMSGNLTFSTTTNVGLVLNNLTTPQQTALVTPPTGAIIFNSTGNVVEVFDGATWQILVTLVNGNSGIVTLSTDDIPENTSLYFTTGRVLGTALTGFVAGGGTVTATDTILSAINKIVGNIGASGPLTSVGLSMPSGFTVAGSPLTANGTLTVTLATQSQNAVLIAPSGSAGTPTWRVLVAGDIPSIAQAQVTGLSTTLALYAPLAGATFTGAVVLPSGTPSGQQATSFAYVSGTYLALAGGTLTGSLTTASVTIGSASSISWATAPTTGNHLVNKTYADTFAPLAGAVMSGPLTFSGTTNPGLRVNNLTTTQMLALASPQTGMIAYDTVLAQLMFYTNGAWTKVATGGGTNWFQSAGAPSNATGQNGDWDLATGTGVVYVKTAGVWASIYSPAISGFLPLGGGTMSGGLEFSGAGNYGISLSNLTTTQQTALTAPAGSIIFNTTEEVPSFYDGSAWSYLNVRYSGGMLQSGTGGSWTNLTTSSLGGGSPVGGTVVTKTTNYTMANTDVLVLANGSLLTITLPASPIVGVTYNVTDQFGSGQTVATGTAAVIKQNSGAFGTSTTVTNTNYGFVWSGTTWWVVSGS